MQETCGKDDYQYSTADDRSACGDHTQCGEGQGSNWSTLTDEQKTTTASQCEDCTSATFSNVASYGPCQARTASCGQGEYFTAVSG